METDDFLSKLDAKLAEQSAKQQAGATERDQAGIEAENYVEAARPVLEELKRYVEQRRIGVKLKLEKRSFLFEMAHDRSGDVRGFQFNEDPRSGQYVVRGVFSEGGKRVTTEGSAPFSRDVAALRDYAQQQILEFVDEFEHHGPAKPPTGPPIGRARIERLL